MQTDTCRQRKLEAALIAHGVAKSWRSYLADARTRKLRGAALMRYLLELGVTVDQRTLQRWMRQATIELAHQKTGRSEASMAEMGFQRDPNQPDP